MKRIISICLCICACALLFACDDKLNQDQPEVQQNATIAPMITQEPVIEATPEPVLNPTPVIPDTPAKSEWGRGRDVSEEETELIKQITLTQRAYMEDFIDGFYNLKIDPVFCIGEKNGISSLLCRTAIICDGFTYSYYSVYFISKNSAGNAVINSEYQINLSDTEKSDTWMQPKLSGSEETWELNKSYDITASALNTFNTAMESQSGRAVQSEIISKYGTGLTLEKYIAVRKLQSSTDYCLLCSADGREVLCFVFISEIAANEYILTDISYANNTKMINAELRFE